MDRENKASALTRRAMVTGFSGVVAATLTTPHVARAAVRVLRFGHNNTEKSHFGRGAVAFANAVTGDPVLGSALRIEVFNNSQLGDDVSMLKGCVNGTLDGAFIGTSIMSNVVPDIGILNAPYLFRDVARARALLDGAIGRDYAALSRAKGLPVLAWGENGLRHVTSNRPVRTVADLKGLKLRVPQSSVMLNGFKALGADAAPLAFPLLREALRSGEFEAQENAIVLVDSSKLYEVQKYLCLTGHIYDAIGFIASPDLVADLTETQLAALAACAAKGAAVTREVADAAQHDGVARLKGLGMTVIDDVDIAGFRTAARPYLESLSASFGAERVTNLLNAGA